MPKKMSSRALTAALWRYHHVGGRVVIGAAILSVVVPPWIIPGAGVLVLVVARGIAYHREGEPDRMTPVLRI